MKWHEIVNCLKWNWSVGWFLWEAWFDFHSENWVFFYFEPVFIFCTGLCSPKHPDQTGIYFLFKCHFFCRLSIRSLVPQTLSNGSYDQTLRQYSCYMISVGRKKARKSKALGKAFDMHGLWEFNGKYSKKGTTNCVLFIAMWIGLLKKFQFWDDKCHPQEKMRFQSQLGKCCCTAGPIRLWSTGYNGGESYCQEGDGWYQQMHWFQFLSVHFRKEPLKDVIKDSQFACHKSLEGCFPVRTISFGS